MGVVVLGCAGADSHNSTTPAPIDKPMARRTIPHLSPSIWDLNWSCGLFFGFLYSVLAHGGLVLIPDCSSYTTTYGAVCIYRRNEMTDVFCASRNKSGPCFMRIGLVLWYLGLNLVR